MKPVGFGALYTLPQPILTHSVPLQTHVTLEPLPAFAATLGSAALLGRMQFHAISSMWQNEASEDHEDTVDSKKPGRKISTLNATLRLFTRADPKHASKPPKLENIRYRIMRTLKKTLRRIYERKNIKRRGLLDVEMKEGHGEELFREFKLFAKRNKQELERFSLLANGPKVDHSHRQQKTSFSTYNNSYLEHVFQSDQVRSIYLHFVGLLYSCDCVESLSKRFAINCCSGRAHGAECRESWKAFKELLENYLGAKVPAGIN